MAATEHVTTSRASAKAAPGGAALLAAALLLPGLAALSPAAQADTPPEKNEVALKFMSYQDGQPGLSRIHVNAPSALLNLKLGEQWSVLATGTHDEVSGASPRYHTDVSGASRMHDERTAFGLKATRYFARGALTVGVDHSTENDYRSRSYSLEGRLSSDDNNTTWNVGTSFSNDRIDPTNFAVIGERKHSNAFLAGVTQVLSPDDVVQLNLGYTRGRGYFSDPYKTLDNRPRSRDQRTLVLAWNHYVAAYQAALRSSYRLYDDSWGVQSHTLGVEWQQAVSSTLSLTPSLRYTTQRAASFYYGPDYDSTYGAPFPAGYQFGSGTYLSPDQRLSAFGGLTAGIKAEWRMNAALSFGVALDRYEQRGGWRLGGGGSSGLASFHATMLQTGVRYRF